MNRFWVKFKSTEIPGFMEKLIEPGEEYLVLGAVGDKLLLQAGENLVEVYPRYLLFLRDA